jgi:hypothetical protein
LLRLLRAAGLAAVCLALVGVVAFAVGHVGLTSRHSGVDEAAAARTDVVRLRWRADELRPARRRGHICVTDDEHGTICAAFAAGERPSDSLRREISRRGLRLRGTPPGSSRASSSAGA